MGKVYPQTKYIYKQWCRHYIAYDIWVPEDGKNTYTIDHAGYVQKMSIQTAPDGRSYVKKQIHKTWKNVPRTFDNVFLDDAVNTCYHGSCPGIGYITNHKDGDLTNNHKDNLEWRKFYRHTMSSTALVRATREQWVIVAEDGTVKHNGKKLDVHDEWLDYGLTNYGSPWVPIYGNGITAGRQNVDELMDKAGYVGGDKYAFPNPVVYHRDHDKMNYDSRNLEWRDIDDPDYIRYMAESRELDISKVMEENKGEHVPNSWLKNTWDEKLNQIDNDYEH